MKKEFARVTPESVGIPSEALLNFLDSINEINTEMHGFMLMRHGKVCSEFWWEPYGPDVKHGSNSLAKTFTGTAIGLAYTEGLLDLDERLADIFPEYAAGITDEKMKRVRVRDMLSMSAGFDKEEFGPTDSMEVYMTRQLAYEPGTHFFYHNGTAAGLGAIVQKKTGLSLQDYLDQKIFKKIGIDTGNFEWLKEDDTGLNAAAGGILSTTEQDLRLMKLYADGGMAAGERLLAEDFVKEAVKPRHKVPNLEGTYLQDEGICYNWMMWGSETRNAYMARGALGQIAMVMPDQDLIVSIHQNSTRKGDLEVVQKFWELVVPFIQDEQIENDGKAYQEFKDRTSHLKLQDAAVSERPEFEKEISGVQFKCKKGFELENETFNMMTHSSKDEPIHEFRFSFGRNTAELLAGKHKIEIGLDGLSRSNTIVSESGHAQDILVCGSWTAEHVFELFIRWVGFSKCKVYRFDFGGEEINLEVYGYSGKERME